MLEKEMISSLSWNMGGLTVPHKQTNWGRPVDPQRIYSRLRWKWVTGASPSSLLRRFPPLHRWRIRRWTRGAWKQASSGPWRSARPSPPSASSSPFPLSLYIPCEQSIKRMNGGYQGNHRERKGERERGWKYEELRERSHLCSTSSNSCLTSAASICRRGRVSSDGISK